MQPYQERDGEVDIDPDGTNCVKEIWKVCG